jgi:hypothetical protein
MRNVISRKENFSKSKERNINGGGANAELISTLGIIRDDSMMYAINFIDTRYVSGYYMVA